jgi:hypothetical protein
MSKHSKNLFAMLLHRSAALLLVLSAALIISCQDITGAANVPDAPALSLVQRLGLATGVNAAIPISSAAELALIGVDRAYPANGDYVLGADFGLDAWIPITNPNLGFDPFTGTFDGAGHTITINSFDLKAVNTNTNLGIFAVIGDGTAMTFPVIADLTVNIAVDPIVTGTARNVGGLAGTVNNAGILDVTVTGSLTVTYNGDAPPPGLKIFRGAETLFVSPSLPIGTNGLAVGGIAGTINSGEVQGAHISAFINAITTTYTVPVFVGGVVGYGNAARIRASESSATIVGDGPGYNTSGGGIAGYILASRVEDSSASGAVDLTGLGRSFTYDDAWQIYAGGLVGYAGGTAAAGSLIDHSHATGPVTAYSPFPYAGGLLGYSYGYNNFSDPASNGTVVSRSYATGDVTSLSQIDPTGATGDIPYAGGLVGYSSVTGSLIEDSYARGSVLAETTGTYAWAGGIIGGNANNSVVNRVYATGDVRSITGVLPPIDPPIYPPEAGNPGPAAGGIAGYDYYTSATVLSNSIALNQLVQGNQTRDEDVVHRVAGNLGNAPYAGTLTNNLAYEGMKVVDNWHVEIGANLRDGDSVPAAQPAQSVYTDLLGWNFGSVWRIGADNYPVLR